MAITAPSENAIKVLQFLKDNFGRELTKQEIVAGTGLSMPMVSSSINNLVKKGYVSERPEEIITEPATETRKAKTKVIRHETLNENGLSYDPMVEYEERKAAEAAAKAAKRAEKAE